MKDKEETVLKENKGKGFGKVRSLAVKVLATGALAAMMCSMASAPVSSYPASSGARVLGVASAEGTENVNYSLHPGATIADGKLTYSLPGIPSRSLWSYKTLPVAVNGRTLADSGALINGMYYLPVRAYLTALGISVSYNSSTKTLTASGRGLYMSATDGGYVIYANDRPIFNFSPNILMSNGKMYASMSSLSKITGLKTDVTGDKISLSGAFSPLKSAEAFYREDEVFWLARIITAEARGESLLGQIAVGNVIMNRVASRLYPNTIYGVIFDRKYGVQFSPVLDGSIYNTPTYTATLAAKIILEGTRLSEDSLFFLNPKTAESSWIVKSREYLYTIGGHDFYR